MLNPSNSVYSPNLPFFRTIGRFVLISVNRIFSALLLSMSSIARFKPISRINSSSSGVPKSFFSSSFNVHTQGPLTLRSAYIGFPRSG